MKKNTSINKIINYKYYFQKKKKNTSILKIFNVYVFIKIQQLNILCNFLEMLYIML